MLTLILRTTERPRSPQLHVVIGAHLGGCQATVPQRDGPIWPLPEISFKVYCVIGHNQASDDIVLSAYQLCYQQSAF